MLEELVLADIVFVESGLAGLGEAVVTVTDEAFVEISSENLMNMKDKIYKNTKNTLLDKELQYI